MKNNMWFKAAFLTFVFCAFGFVQSRADIQLTVDVANKTASTVVVVYQTTIVEIPLDDNGHGSHTFQHIGAVHASLFYGMDSKNIFLEDGDRIHISFDGADFKETVKFEADGGKEKIFKYLNQVTLLDVPQEKMALPFDEYAALVDKNRPHPLCLCFFADDVRRGASFCSSGYHLPPGRSLLRYT